ncbi:MAG: hypothetical protein Q7U74_06145, partial [Saprospiraceae bacterium]|nr:hypothetical protein [Saprospiraceae bacterium]
MEASIGEVLVSIIAQFEIGELPVFRPHSLFPFPNVPATKWDRPNRIRLLMAGTCDARSRRQWRRVGRSVKKDAKPIFIMVPNLKRARTGKEGNKSALHKKFIPMPVFRVEDTAGQPLEYKPITIPDLPLIEKARQWGISVKTEPGMFKRLGHYDKDRREILLA